MNTVPSLSTAAAATSISLAIIVILRWALHLIHVDLPPDVGTAIGTILTNVFHWFVIKPNCFSIFSDVEPQK
jgi:hypothetical protein